MRPVVYMLCGLPCSGKTTYAKKLEAKGIRKLTVDEAVFEQRSSGDGGYQEDKDRDLEKAVVASVEQLLLLFLEGGQPVILDFGFWTKEKRDHYKQMVEQNGGEWKLLYFKAEPAVLMRRLQAKSRRDGVPSITKAVFLGFVKKFDEPAGEGEEIFLQGQT